MTGVFKGNNPFNYFLLLIYGIILKLSLFTEGAAVLHFENDGILYSFITNALPNGQSRLLGIFCFVIFFWQALSMNRVSNALHLLPADNFLPGMTYLLLSSGSAAWLSLSAPLLAVSLMIIIFSNLCRLHTHPSPAALIFNSSMLLGLAILIYYPLALLVLFLLAGVIISRPFVLREWVMALIGLMVPFYLAWSYFFLTDNTSVIKVPRFQFQMPHWSPDLPYVIWISLLGLSLLSGLLLLQVNRGKMLVQTRRYWHINIILFVLSLLIPFLDASSNLSRFPLLLLSGSFIISSFLFYPEKRAFPMMMHWILFLLTCYLLYVN